MYKVFGLILFLLCFCGRKGCVTSYFWRPYSLSSQTWGPHTWRPQTWGLLEKMLCFRAADGRKLKQLRSFFLKFDPYLYKRFRNLSKPSKHGTFCVVRRRFLMKIIIFLNFFVLIAEPFQNKCHNETF